MIVLVGKAAAGKDTLVRKLIEVDPRFTNIVAYTTRPMRPQEVQDVQYHFIGKRGFDKLVEKGFLIGTTTFNDWNYGIPSADCGKNMFKIAVLSPTGYRDLVRRGIPVLGIYLDTDDNIRLARQALRRDKPHEIFRRFMHDEGQFEGIEDEVQYVIKNISVTDNTDELIEIIQKIVADEENKLKEEDKEETESNEE